MLGPGCMVVPLYPSLTHACACTCNPSLATGAYSTIGSNGALTANPAVIHFGGFEMGKSFKQVMRIINTSPVSRRLHIIPPSTPFFKVRRGAGGRLGFRTARGHIEKGEAGVWRMEKCHGRDGEEQSHTCVEGGQRLRCMVLT